MLDQLTAFRLARREFQQRLDGVGDEQWTDPTPCSEWDVSALVQHLIDGDTFAALLLHGSSLHDAIEALVSETDPRDFGTEADALDEAFAGAEPGLTVDHPVGVIPLEDFLEFRSADYAGHAWDLARATGQPEALDTRLIEHLWARSEARVDMFATSEHFGGGTGQTGLASLQDRWLDRIGRRP